MSKSMVRWSGWFALAASVYSVGAVGQASNTTPEEEYRKLIRINEDIQPLGETPFGENVSLYDGRLSFSNTDISVSGTGPLIQINRSFQIESYGDRDRLKDNAFGDWEMEIPRISTITATQLNVQGWMVLGNEPRKICHRFSQPPGVDGMRGDSMRHSWQPQDWWHGYQLVVPGAGSQDLLSRSSSYTVTPSVGSNTFVAITKQNWQVGCVDQSANDATRDAFLVVAPDGTQYRLDYLSTRWASIISRPLDTWSTSFLKVNSLSSGGMVRPMAAAEQDDLYREEAAMLATQVTDRFGNWVKYHYDDYGTSKGRLVLIDASDGRKVSLAYDGNSRRVKTITVQPGAANARTWTYNYAIGAFQIPTLTSISQPDGSSWTFDLAAISANSGPNFVNSDSSSCSILSPPTNVTEFPGSIIHPSGLRGDFVVKPTRRGRSYVYKQCFGGDPSDSESGSALLPNAWFVTSIVSKTFSGSGMDTARWDYRLSPSNESWEQNCAGGCAGTVWTDVSAPDGSTTRYEFSNRYDKTESRLLSTSVYTGAATGVPARREWDEYAEPTQGPFPPFMGADLQRRTNTEQTTRWTPVRKHVIEQDQNTFVSEVTEFDIFAQAVRTTRYNNVAGQSAIDQRTDLLNDTANWVLGLPLRTFNYSANEEVSRNVYTPGSLTLAERYSFGRKVMGYEFDGQGQLSKFTDGNGHSTTLSDYARGIPRWIAYPDTTRQRLEVDEQGQITSITNQAGATTSYLYDEIGRLKRITYPSETWGAWNTKDFGYALVGSDRGADGPHWRRSVNQGSKVQMTYFDVMMRPVLAETYRSDGAMASSLKTEYDWKGRKTFQSYAYGDLPARSSMSLGVSTRYDVLGRVTQSMQSSELGNLLTTTSYGQHATKVVIDPKENATTTQYQVFDQPTYDAVTSVSAPEGVAQTIVRDLYGNPLSITQGGGGGLGHQDDDIRW